MTQQHPPRAKRRTRVGRLLERGISIYGAIVFVILWAGIIVGVAGGGALFADAWAWLTSLETLAAVVTWILLLPIAVGLWAWSAGLAAWATALVLVGLVVWTGVAINGFITAFRRRPHGIAR